MQSLSFLQPMKERPTLLFQERIHNLQEIDSIAFVGSSGAGKSTLVNEIKENLPEVFCPLRYITRSSRMNEADGENCHVTEEDFSTLVKEGEISIHWVRDMEEGKKAYYGFKKGEGKTFTIYSANNDFFRKIGEQERMRTLIVGVYAPDEVREERLAERSPDLNEKERKYRLGDSSEVIRDAAHLLINNHGHDEATAKKDIVALVKELYDHWARS